VGDWSRMNQYFLCVRSFCHGYLSGSGRQLLPNLIATV
jgi:hypothetical protein